ncbi:EAL domain-containing protein [Evansella sp. AB-P1]|uniref:EAL domain-containing protein n=1 Tax=Evansella sp. AB-P1 TaxID=3037653 RepID=UPI00241D5D13|nr:EAL domain-containing protein [Evansella sp. AB-P1]MDG5787499.1 EAL domain-containing protein [Evansella sp. AB-P1]
MSLDFLSGVIISIIIGVITTSLLYIYYYYIERRKYILFWLLGWFFYSLRLITLFITLHSHPSYLTLMMYDSFALFSVFFILIGTLFYFEKKVKSFWFILLILGVIWSFCAIINNWSFFLHQIIPSMISSGIFIYIGIALWKRNITTFLTNILSILFILKGIHRLDYPFLRQVESFVPFGYLINEFLLLLIIIFFAILIHTDLRNRYIESEIKYESITNTTEDLIYTLDLSGNVVNSNSKFKKHLIKSNHKAIHHISYYFPNISLQLESIINKIKETGQLVRTELKHVTHSGSVHYFEVSLIPIYNANNSIVAVNGIHHDITNEKEKSEMINRMAYYDPLTGLPNRNSLFDHICEKIESFSTTSFSVMFIGLNQFKKINQLSGTSVGDELLKMVGRSMKIQLKDKGFVSRYRSDQFVIVTKDNDSIDDIINIIYGLFKTHWLVKKLKLQLTASIGVSKYPNDGNKTELLINNAKIAYHFCKEEGSTKTIFYNKKLLELNEKKSVIETAFFNGMEQKEFILHFQPQIRIEDSTIIGFEALIRWNHPKIGPISPAEFIPIAEKNGLIIPIGNWVMYEACKAIRLLHREFGKDYKISINISSVQLQQEDFVNKLIGAIEYWNISPTNLEIEITESVLIGSFQTSYEKLLKVNELGIQISLDDFGTGYSSFSYLTKLPIYMIKVDKSFIDGVNDDEQAAILLEKLIGLVKHMKKSVLVEGVEDKDQFKKLLEWNCDYIQGYYISEPLSMEELCQFLKNNSLANNS